MTVLALALTLLMATVAALCAMADGALLSLNPEDGLPEPLRALHGRRERTHRALAFGRVVGQLGAGIGVAATVWSLPGGGWWLMVLAAAVATTLVGVSEPVARSIGDLQGERAAARLLPLVVAVERVLAPVVAFGEVIDRSLTLLLPPPENREEARSATTEQFVQVVAAETEASRDEQVLLNGVFRLRETEVHEIMVPRVDVVAIDRDDAWSEVVDRVLSSEHSRLPVYASSVDNVIGVLYAKDLLTAVHANREPDGGWTSLLRPPVFIPGSKKADAQLRDFQASRTHMAIVADEYGGTAGIVTIEDVLEEIVGEIRDEYDDVEEASVVVEDDRRYWVSARLTLAELSDVLGHDVEREGVSTVGGLVYELLGRVPRAGEEFSLDGFRVVVERVTRRRVQRVFFERPAADTEHAA